MRRLALLLVLAGCAVQPTQPTRVHADGREVILEGATALRGVILDLAWDPALGVTDVTPGEDATRMNLYRVQLADDGGGARVLVTDSRKIKLPVRGTLAHVEASGDGEVRIVGAQGAGDEGEPVEIELP